MDQFDARYFDGMTARPHDASVQAGPEGIRFTTKDGAAVHFWPAEELRLAERRRTGAPVRLCRNGSGGERLEFADPAAIGRVDAVYGKLKLAGSGRGNLWRPIAFWSVGAIAAAAFFLFVVVPVLAERIAAWMPPEAETKLGQTVARQMATVFSGSSESPFCTSPDSDRALASLTARLEAQLGYPGDIRVRVVRSPVVNAFALPGGQILLFDGLLKFAESPEAVAGVLAHELGHVAERHPMEVFLKNAGAGAMIGLLFGDVTGGTLIAAGTQLYLSASYGREAEREADEAAIAILNAVDIDGLALMAFFDRLEARGDDIPDFLEIVSTHPGYEERREYVRAHATGRGAALTDTQWRALRGICG